MTAESETGPPVALFSELYRVFQGAEQRSGTVSRFYRVGDCSVRLRFAGPALIPRLTPALAHLLASPDPGRAFTICLWDSASTGTELPAVPWSRHDYLPRGEIRGYSDGRFSLAIDVGTGVVSMLDTRRDLALYWVRDAATIPYYESGAPLRPILHWHMCARGRQLVHGAAVGTPRAGLLLVGRGGSGKSVTALAGLTGGLTYVADDYCLLATEPEPYVYSLYNSAKIHGADVRKFPHLVSMLSNADCLDTEKALFFLHPQNAAVVSSGLPLRAIVLPRVTGSALTKLTTVSAGEALAALAPSTLFQLPGADRRAFRMMASCVRRIPCYRLELGTELSQIPKVILPLVSGG